MQYFFSLTWKIEIIYGKKEVELGLLESTLSTKLKAEIVELVN